MAMSPGGASTSTRTSNVATATSACCGGDDAVTTTPSSLVPVERTTMPADSGIRPFGGSESGAPFSVVDPGT